MANYKMGNYKSTLFEIEVMHGSIYIDSADVELEKKVQSMYDEIDRVHAELDKSNKRLKALKLSEEERNAKELEEVVKFIDASYNAINTLFNGNEEKLRGINATDKIFQSKSYTGVLQFIEELMPMFERFGVQGRINIEEFEKEMSNKYKPLEIETSGVEVIE